MRLCNELWTRLPFFFFSVVVKGTVFGCRNRCWLRLLRCQRERQTIGANSWCSFIEKNRFSSEETARKGKNPARTMKVSRIVAPFFLQRWARKIYPQNPSLSIFLFFTPLSLSFSLVFLSRTRKTKNKQKERKVVFISLQRYLGKKSRRRKYLQANVLHSRSAQKNFAH